MSKASIVLLTFLAMFSLVTNHVCGQPPTEPTYTLAMCETEAGNYTTAEYDTNLITVLTTLIQQASSTSMFYTTSAGTGPDTVYGQYYCRGDITSELCGQCVGQAAKAAVALCPLAKAAAVFFKECTLHYENQPLFGVESVRPGAYLLSLSNVTDPTAFFTAANSTMTDALMEAVDASTKFATGEGTVSATETVYCLVQCSPDLNATQCHSCLGNAADVLVTCCGEWPSFLYVFLPSCQMAYDTRGAFYFAPDATPPPPAVPSSTPPASLNSVRIKPIPAKA